MIFDNEQQRKNVLACITVTAGTMRIDAGEEVFAQHAALVQLRREVDAASIAEAPVEPAGAHGEAWLGQSANGARAAVVDAL